MRILRFAVLAMAVATPVRAASLDQTFADAVFFCTASMAPKMWFETSGYAPASGGWMEKAFGASKVAVLPKEPCQAMLHGRPDDPAAVEAGIDKKLGELPTQFETSPWVWTSLEQLGPGQGYHRKTFLQRNGREAIKLYLSRTGLATGKPASVSTSYSATVRRYKAFSLIGMNGPVGAAVTDALSNCARATSKPSLAALARAMGYEEKDRDEYTLRVLDDAKLMTFYSNYDNSCSVYVTSEEADDPAIMRAAKSFISAGGEATARATGGLSTNDFKVTRVEYTGMSAVGPQKLVLDHRVPRNPLGRQAQRFRLTLSTPKRKTP